MAFLLRDIHVLVIYVLYFVFGLNIGFFFGVFCSGGGGGVDLLHRLAFSVYRQG